MLPERLREYDLDRRNDPRDRERLREKRLRPNDLERERRLRGDRDAERLELLPFDRGRPGGSGGFDVVASRKTKNSEKCTAGIQSPQNSLDAPAVGAAANLKHPNLSNTIGPCLTGGAAAGGDTLRRPCRLSWCGDERLGERRGECCWAAACLVDVAAAKFGLGAPKFGFSLSESLSLTKAYCLGMGRVGFCCVATAN
jgi:hypothetical protein